MSYECELSDNEKLAQVRQLYRQARVSFSGRGCWLTNINSVVLEAASQIESHPLQRLLLYLVDTVLEHNDPVEPKVINIAQQSLLPHCFEISQRSFAIDRSDTTSG